MESNTMDEQEIVDVAKLESEVEARLLGAILDERDIAHAILSYHDTAYDGLYQVQKGWGVVRAGQSDSREILTILEDLRNGEAALDQIDAPEDQA